MHKQRWHLRKPLGPAHFTCLMVVLLACCRPGSIAHMEWVPSRVQSLDSIHPIGIARTAEGLWLSDGDQNRLVLLNKDFQAEAVVDSLDRPMHISASEGRLFVPQYGNDRVEELYRGARTHMELPDSLDAPAGVAAYGAERAIADFYNNRILYFNGSAWLKFGTEGKEPGAFYYPTDVQITGNHIWVADAYNNRVQVFDKSGGFVRMFGMDQKMNAATGVFVSDTSVFVTDFENDRVLVFKWDGSLMQVLEEGIHKPTDVLMEGDTLYICNYRQAELLVYTLEEVTVEKDPGP